MNYMQVITLRSTSLKGLMTAAQAALRKQWNSQMAATELTLIWAKHLLPTCRVLHKAYP